MASIKVKIRPSTASSKGRIYYQLIHQRKVKNVNTDFVIELSDWDSRCSMPAMCEPTGRLSLLRSTIESDLNRFCRLKEEWEGRGQSYTVEQLAAAFARRGQQGSFLAFVDGVALRLRLAGRLRTADTYAAARRSLALFLGGADVGCDAITAELMLCYECHLRERGAKPNTVSFYMRILRAAYNRAVEQGLAVQRHPFRQVYTGVEKTAKRALGQRALRRILALPLLPSSAQAWARDLFFFSLFTRGMSFVDMAFLRKSDLQNGRLVYRRHKTGQLLSVRWEECMRQIVERHPAPPASPYLLPIIGEGGRNERAQYLKSLFHVNYYLKRVGRMAGIEQPLTLYVARHSWASLARNKNVPLSVISEGMGHDSESTTRIYLASLDSRRVDRANKKIIKAIKGE